MGIVNSPSQPLSTSVRLDIYLTRQGLFPSRQQAIQAIRSRAVFVEGVAAEKPSLKVRFGQRIEVKPLPPPSGDTLPKDQRSVERLDILYEEGGFLVIHKPAGLVVHGAPTVKEPTVVDSLRAQGVHLSEIGAPERAGIVHRLDKETSGLLLVAKEELLHLQLARLFQQRQVQKRYLAIVHGKPKQVCGTLTTPFGRHPTARHKMAVLPPRTGRRLAKTSYQLLSVSENRDSQDTFSLLELKPITGRTHQIRVHLHYLGIPVAGDKTYGKRSSFSRQLLHHYSLSFPHPESGIPLRFTSPIPKDFQDALEKCSLLPLSAKSSLPQPLRRTLLGQHIPPAS